VAARDVQEGSVFHLPPRGHGACPRSGYVIVPFADCDLSSAGAFAADAESQPPGLSRSLHPSSSDCPRKGNREHDLAASNGRNAVYP